MRMANKKNSEYQYDLDSYSLYDFENKERILCDYMNYMFMRTQSMFRYENLPETIDKRNLELMLQRKGHVCFYKVNNDLYVFTGSLGGKPDVYYMPTLYTVANPALNISVSAEINKDCVVMPNDSLYIGLVPMFRKYSTMMLENDITLRIADINSRVISLLSAPDERTRVSAESYLKSIVNGKLGVIAETALFDGIKVHPYTSTANNHITNLIEYHQYLKASWYNDLGLQSNYNMKRESINSDESQLNEDSLLPLIDNMLECRQVAIDKVNEMFGTNIKVELNSSWKNTQIDIENSQELVECEIDSMKQDIESSDENISDESEYIDSEEVEVIE